MKQFVNKELLIEVLEKNIHRLILLSVILIPISVGHAVYFYTNLDSTANFRVYNWQLNIGFSHVILSSGFLIFAILGIIIERKGLCGMFVAKALIILASFFMVLIGGLISSFDQAVTSSITPFFLAIILISLIFIQEPIRVAIYLLTGLVFFYFLQSHYQTDVIVARSNFVNAIAISGASFFLTLVLWRSYLVLIYQTKVIHQQKEELQHHVDVLEKREKELLLANKSKDRFFSIIAHDLRNPIGSMMGLLNLMTDKGYAKSQTKENLDVTLIELQKSASSTFYLLENLLYWSKDQEDKMSFHPKIVRLKNLVLSVVGIFSIPLDQKKIIINVDQIDPELWIYADSNMLKAVLRNLIANSIKFSHLNGEIKLIAFKRDQSVVIQVEDFGIGIPKNKLEQIFLDETMETTAGTFNETGTGLGLLLCKDFMNHHQGKIELLNKDISGAIFELTFPDKIQKEEF